MTLCPVALAIGCRKCPLVSICPGKSIIGDYKPDEAAGASGNGKPAESKDQQRK